MFNMNVKVDNGKYEYVLKENGESYVLRHGEPWQDVTGNNLIFNLAYELDQERAISEELERIIEEEGYRIKSFGSGLCLEKIK